MGTIQHYSKNIKMGVMAACLATLSALVFVATPTHAATPPDTCFSFDGGTGTISTYYDNENNDTAQPACPKNVDIPATIDVAGTPTPVTAIGYNAFNNKALTAVTIPGSITSIGAYSFERNQLTAITIPSSVTNIGTSAFEQNQLTTANWPSGVTTISDRVFYNNKLASFTIPTTVQVIGEEALWANQLSSITIPNSVTAIGELAFALNKIVSVTLPNSVTSLSPLAFMLQNPEGGNGITSDVGIFTLTSYWYAQVYTEDPTNPHNLPSFAYIVTEEMMGGDINGDGDTNDRVGLGGQIINPTSVTISARSTSGTQLLPDSTQVGALADGTAVADYSVLHTLNSIPDLGTLITQNGGDEAAAIAASDPAMKAVYYTAGASKTFTAPTITGYTLQSPASPHAMTLAARTNTLNFIYTAAQNGSSTATPTAPNAPDTGANSNTMLAALVGTIAFVTGVTFAGLRIAAARRR